MKKLFFMLFAAIMILCALTISTSAANEGIAVYIDNVPVNFTADSGFPFTSGSRTLVPLRVTMESYGAEVEWQDNCAIIRKGTTTVRCKIGESCIYRNNVRVDNDAAAVISNSRTYLPIRAVLEAFGAKVDWDGSVKVTSPDGGALIYRIENNPSVTTNYWGIWNKAIELKNSGQYRSAIDTILSISSIFIAQNPGASSAMLFKHLGECYSNLKDYTSAAACFKREAYHWTNAAGMEQSVIDANRRSNLIKSSTQVYVKNYDASMGAKINFGVKYEPSGGVLLGAYAEGDTSIYDPYNPSRFYMSTFPQLVGKDMAGYLLYIPYGSDISIYDSHFSKAAEHGKMIQIALEPRNGLWQINNTDGYLIKFAKEAEERAKECGIMLRFGGEMNDYTSQWYTSNPGEFIEKFRIVANVFHTYAPSVPIIWAPNFFPSDNINSYYPGDEYVDYVGLSSYQNHTPVTDPLNMGVDRSRWSNQLDFIYANYGHKKPILIAEGGASYMDYDTYADVTPYASRQMKDFLTYLPIKYPNVKMFFVFDTDRDRIRLSLSNNYQYLAAYSEGIQSDLYRTDYRNSPYTYDYYELGNNVKVKAEPTELCSYITTPENNVAYVAYTINGATDATAYDIPYSASVDFTQYKGQRVSVQVSAFGYDHSLLNTYEITINVI